MKKVLILLLLLLLPINVKALTCKYENLARYKKYASNITTTYDYQEYDNEVTFSVTLVNLRPEFYIVDTSTGQTYQYVNTELTIPGYASGKSLIYEVYSNQSGCEGQLLYTVRVILPTYNRFYQAEICNDIKEYSLCQKWSSHGLTYSEFERKINAYKESLNNGNQGTTPLPKVEPTILDYIFKIVGEYYYVILILIITSCGIGIYVIDKKSNTYS